MSKKHQPSEPTDSLGHILPVGGLYLTENTSKMTENDPKTQFFTHFWPFLRCTSTFHVKINRFWCRKNTNQVKLTDSRSRSTSWSLFDRKHIKNDRKRPKNAVFHSLLTFFEMHTHFSRDLDPKNVKNEWKKRFFDMSEKIDFRGQGAKVWTKWLGFSL